MRQCVAVKSHVDAVDSNLPSLIKIKKLTDETTVQAYIEMWIVNLLNFLNIGKTMNDDQIFQTALMIVSDFPNLNLADIHLVFKMAKMGKMGQFYDRMDGQVILSWFESYWSERCSICAQRSVIESMKFKGNNVPSFDKIAELAEKKRF